MWSSKNCLMSCIPELSPLSITYQHSPVIFSTVHSEWDRGGGEDRAVDEAKWGVFEGTER